MGADVDPNAVVATVLTDLIRGAFDTAIRGASRKIQTAWNKVFGDFDPYCRRIYQRNSQVRILCLKDKDVPLYDIYVPCKFRSSDGIFSDEDVIQDIRDGARVVVSGNGGTGKTFFMRHLWMTIFQNPAGKVPLFIELRNLNRSGLGDLELSIISAISPENKIDAELFDYFCLNGIFCFIFDGFDEVASEIRDLLQSSIIHFSNQYPKCPIIVSSRPDERFSGWQQFHVLSPMPFEYDQMIGLVDRMPVAEDVKESFKVAADQRFFSRHESFLSNPLLCIMMVMTFRDNMDIPENMNAFYDQAFITLFSSHDATKAWSRKSALNMEQFRRVFGIFSAISYYDEKFEFNEYELQDYIEKSRRITNIDVSLSDIRRDIIECVNLMQQDGLYIYFIHRSFQEYFAAYAITRLLNDRERKFIDKIKLRTGDDVISMAFEMNEHIIINNYIIPEIEEYKVLGSEEVGLIGIDVLEASKCKILIEFRKNANGAYYFRILGPIPDELRSFLVNLQKMKAESSTELLSVFERSDVTEMVRLIIDEFDELLNAITDVDLNVMIQFTDGQIRFSENVLIGNSEVSGVVDRIKKRIEERAEEDGENLKIIINSARKWYLDKINEDRNRASSIDEIFDL